MPANGLVNDVVMVGHAAMPMVAPAAMDSIVDFDLVAAIEHFASVAVASTSIGASVGPSHSGSAVGPIEHHLACYSISCLATWRIVADRNRHQHQPVGNCQRPPFVGHAYVAVDSLAVDSSAAACALFVDRSDSTEAFLADCVGPCLVG